MIELYLTFVKSHPLLSSAIQVALLGTFGEMLAIRIRSLRWQLPGGSLKTLLAKFAIWALLGISFKYAFTGFGGFVDTISAKGFWFTASPGTHAGNPLSSPPLAGGAEGVVLSGGQLSTATILDLILRAFSISFFCNLLFGPVMMTFHRWTDNMIEGKAMDWASLQKAWWTLAWFWIPAHTITFCLPPHLQVGLAAVWAVALGVILGLFAKSR